LPRRGDTIDQGDNEGYSRLDDGDTDSFWKTNPYLDQEFTREPNANHPAWIVIEFDKARLINAARLVWADPFATAYRVQYADFDDISDIALNPPGMWRDFPGGVVPGQATVISNTPVAGGGHDTLLRLSAQPIKTRFVRVLMTRSSNTALPGSTDLRDRLGFAMREVYFGSIDQAGSFTDEIKHGTKRDQQTLIHVSSTDPWHTDRDLDEGVEQPGFDRIYLSGLTNNLPVLLPTGIFYDTPENAANEIRHLRSRGFKFDRVELGEEPDGQYATPEDYGALFIQWARAIHAVDPRVKLGGPSFQEIQPDTEPRQVKLGNSAWMRRFLAYLSARGHLRDYAFFSFEWYPFDDVCESVPAQLARATDMLTNALNDMRRRGVPRSIPWIISEYGYSAFATRSEIDMPGALLNADIVGRFFTMGGDQAFLYGYTPAEILPDSPCDPGNNMLFEKDEDGHITQRFAVYFGARLVTEQWFGEPYRRHEVYPAVSTLQNEDGEALVTVYALHRPDGLWSLLLINKDPQRDFQVGLRFRNEVHGSIVGFGGSVDIFQYSAKQYALNDDRKNPATIRAEPPEHRTVAAPDSLVLPAYSLTVVRGAVPGLKLN